MPFSSHHKSPSTSSIKNAQKSPFSTSSGLIGAAQALGSIGAPTANLRALNNPGPTTPAGAADNHHSSPASTPRGPPPSGRSHTRSISGYETAFPPERSIPSNAPPLNSNRASIFSQAHDELQLHLGTPAEGTPQLGQGFKERTPGTTPRISLEHSSPNAAPTTDRLPGALQSGANRQPPPLQRAPTIPVLTEMAQDGYSAPPRPSGHHNHSFSGSSPNAGYDGQNLSPFAGAGSSADVAHFMSPSQKYIPQGQQRNVPNTPLGLADIRPRADSTMSDILPGANPYSYDGNNVQPTNSNYLAPWAIYAFDWCKWPAQGHDAGKVAVGSYLEDGHNFIQILESQITPTSPGSYTPGESKYGLEFNKIAEATHSYPVTRLLWEPPSSQKQSTDLLATSGDHLRLWSLPTDTPMSSPGSSITRPTNQGRDLPPTKLTPLALLSNSKTPEHTAPLTSLDWNTVSPSLIITSSIDTTCTIWDIPTLTAKTQLIAHDKEVFDVRFCANSVDVFVSCGADGSVRMFDLRSLEHSTIIYEPTAKDDKDPNAPGGRVSPTLAQQTMSYAPPLLRLAASPHDQHLLATFSQDSNIIRILDVRQPGQALLELHGHGAAINCIEWSPNRRGTLASGADDSLVLVWDLLSQSQSAVPPGPSTNGAPAPDNSRGPAASWRCDYEVGNISWAPHSALSNDNGDWLGVSGGRGIWGVKL